MHVVLILNDLHDFRSSSFGKNGFFHTLFYFSSTEVTSGMNASLPFSYIFLKEKSPWTG